MPFVVPDSLISQPIPYISGPTRGTPAGIAPDAKAALCLRWLFFKMTHSKQKPEQRMALVFQDMEELAAGARATINSFESEDLSSLGRRHSVHLLLARGHQDGKLSMLLEGLQHKHDAVLGILVSNRRLIYPVAAYRSGGKAGLAPHIYLFFPGIGELKGIRPKDFANLADRGLGLADGDQISCGKVFSAQPLAAVAVPDESGDSPTLDEGDYAVLGSRGYHPAGSQGHAVDDGDATYARLGQFSATNYEIAPIRERIPSDSSEASARV